jgi:ribosomal protein L37AE/L43A
MSNIIPLHKEKPQAKAKKGSQYVCTRCDGWTFTLSELGMVHCVSCGALMRNLLVVPTGGNNVPA